MAIFPSCCFFLCNISFSRLSVSRLFSWLSSTFCRSVGGGGGDGNWSIWRTTFLRKHNIKYTHSLFQYISTQAVSFICTSITLLFGVFYFSRRFSIIPPCFHFLHTIFQSSRLQYLRGKIKSNNITIKAPFKLKMVLRNFHFYAHTQKPQ